MIGKKSKTIIVIGLTVLLLGAGVVLGQNTQQATSPMIAPLDRDWSENFDSYDAGSALHGQGGWYAWDNRSVATGYVSNAQARSSPNSLEGKWFTTEASDMVHQYSGYDTGTWVYTAWVYVPSTMTGRQFLILMNKYVELNHVLQDWSLQVEFSASGGYIRDYDNTQASLPLVTDQWMEIRAVIDLEADVDTVYYGGTQFIQKSWTAGVSPGGQKNIACVDLWAGDISGTTSCYWDDLSLLPPVPPLSCDADGPYSGFTGAQIQFSGSATGGTPPYTWEWEFGDGATSTLQNPMHAYTLPGLYTVNLTVTDSVQATAEDETTANITQALVPEINIGKISGGKGISAVIWNNGTANATMVPWSITLTGGFILKGKSTTGTITQLGIGESHTISASVFGIGRPTITVSAGDKEKTAKGFVILIFVLGLK
jgi:PKD repeat protein